VFLCRDLKQGEEFGMLRLTLALRAKDPFKALGLSRSATKPEVKAKYRDLAKQYHPDNTRTGDAKMIEEINRAYNLLLKEGAYERLHTKSMAPMPGVTTSSRPEV